VYACPGSNPGFGTIFIKKCIVIMGG